MSNRSGKVLVTGGSGHLGANLVRRLLAEGEEVRCLVHPLHRNHGLDGLDIERVEGDLRDLEQMRKAVSGCRRVYHCGAKVSTIKGAEEEVALFENNVLGTRNTLRACLDEGVDKVVVTGSLSAVGFDPDNPQRPTDEEYPYHPFAHHMPYGRTKHLVEYYSMQAALRGLDVCVAISTGIVGPNDYLPSRMGRVFCDFVNGALRGYIPGGFEFVAADDIVEGHLLAMEKGRKGERYIFSTQFMTLDDLFDLFEKVSGKKRPWLRLSPGLMRPIARVNTAIREILTPNDLPRLTPLAIKVLTSQRHTDTTKAQKELGFCPSSMEEAVRQAYTFYREQNMMRS